MVLFAKADGDAQVVGHAVAADGADDNAFMEQCFINRLRRAAAVEGDKVGHRGNGVQAQCLQAFGDLHKASGVFAFAVFDVVVIVERGGSGSQCRGVDVEWLAHAIKDVGDFRIGHGVTDAQTGQPVHFREGAGDDQVAVAINEFKPVGIAFFFNIFHVGFIQHHQHFFRHALHKTFQRLTMEPGAGGIVRVGDKNNPGALGDGIGHGSEIVAEQLGRHFHRLGGTGQRDQHVHGKGMLGKNHFVATIKKAAADQFEQVVRAVAKRELFGAQAEFFP